MVLTKYTRQQEEQTYPNSESAIALVNLGHSLMSSLYDEMPIQSPCSWNWGISNKFMVIATSPTKNKAPFMLS